ncbi:methyltransferase, partial [Mycobacterium avium subsp. avium 10-9275]
MTRIIGGVAGGRRLAVPPGHRPTTDRVRESLFNILAARRELTGLAVLDLYAGSGALGLEALSRGAATALFVESDPRAAAVIARNIDTLGLPGA